MNDTLIDDILCREAEQLDPPMWFDAEEGIFCFEDEGMAYYYIRWMGLHRNYPRPFLLHYPHGRYGHDRYGFFETLEEAHAAAYKEQRHEE
jgi:hypothetical protein